MLEYYIKFNAGNGIFKDMLTGDKTVSCAKVFFVKHWVNRLSKTKHNEKYDMQEVSRVGTE